MSTEFSVQPLNDFTAKKVAATRAYRQSDAGRAARRDYARRWAKTEAGKANGRRRDARRRVKRGIKPRATRQTKEARQAVARACRARLKDALYRQLGGVCCRCGFEDPRALQIDHIYGGGNREDPHRDTAYYRRVLRSVRVEAGRYQLLCANCNWIKVHQNGEAVARPRRRRELEDPMHCQGVLAL